MPPGHMLYGVAFILPIVFILINIRNLRKDKPEVLTFFIISFAIYFTVFYLIDENKQGAPISSLMESSFKRGMFCFIPILLFYSATCNVGKWISNKIEKFRLS
jgi:amino acid permease